MSRCARRVSVRLARGHRCNSGPRSPDLGVVDGTFGDDVSRALNDRNAATQQRQRNDDELQRRIKHATQQANAKLDRLLVEARDELHRRRIPTSAVRRHRRSVIGAGPAAKSMVTKAENLSVWVLLPNSRVGQQTWNQHGTSTCLTDEARPRLVVIPRHPEALYPSDIITELRVSGNNHVSLIAPGKTAYQANDSDLSGVPYFCMKPGNQDDRPVWQPMKDWLIDRVADIIGR